jgi:hypothetical protein
MARLLQPIRGLYSLPRRPVLHGRFDRGGGGIRRMPLNLSATELETAARACRALAYQESESAKKNGEPADAGSDRERRASLCSIS